MKESMKAAHGALAACALALVLAACNGKDGGSAAAVGTDAQSPAAIRAETVHAPVYTKADGVMIFSGWGFCTELDNGKMVAAAESAIGDAVQIYTDAGAPFEKEAVQRFQNGTEEPYTFVKVSFEGTDYWTRTACVAREGTAAVVLEDSYLFDAPDLATMTKATVKRGDIVVVYDGNSEFDGLLVYRAKSPYGEEMHVLKGTVSTDSGVIDEFATRARLESYAAKTKAEEQLKPVVREEVTALLERRP